jgi:3-dehydroquinate dehydratase-1
MMLQRSVKGSGALPLLVAVISSGPDLVRAARLRQMPDFFELRLDALAAIADEVETSLARLHVPLIMTARHPLEGGRNALPVHTRRDLLLRFLPHAELVDVELRCVEQLREVMAAAKRRNIRRLISVHDLRCTPPVDRLQALADAAAAAGADLFKIVTRTDTPDELDRLLSFFDASNERLAISAMGIGKLGRASRRLLAARGSALNYAHLGTSAAEGQLSLAEMRRLLRASARTSAISRPRRSV